MKYIENQVFENKKINKLNDIQFSDCIFKNCHFEKSEINKSQFLECTFEFCTFVHISFHYSQMRNIVLKNCECIGIDFSLVKPMGTIDNIFSHCEHTFFKYCMFKILNLKKYKAQTNTYEQCSFHQCDLTQASFKECNLLDTDFHQCKLEKADFRESYGYRIDLETNQLKGASFSLPEVIHLLDGLGIKID